MHWKHFAVLFLSLIVVSARAGAQVSPSATSGRRIPLTIGAGWSNYSIDWGPGRRMDGITAWADWRFRGLPSYLKGLGVSLEGQCICWNVPEDIGKHKLQAGLGGPSYRYERWQRVRPYGKFLIGFGGVYFNFFNTNYSHDTRVFTAPGGGADVYVWNKLAIRGDYEYQSWSLFGQTSNPNGFTLGAVWDFGMRPAQE